MRRCLESIQEMCFNPCLESIQGMRFKKEDSLGKPHIRWQTGVWKNAINRSSLVMAVTNLKLAGMACDFSEWIRSKPGGSASARTFRTWSGEQE